MQIYVHAHLGLRDDMQEWAVALAALMDASRPTAAAFIADFVDKVCWLPHNTCKRCRRQPHLVVLPFGWRCPLLILRPLCCVEEGSRCVSGNWQITSDSRDVVSADAGGRPVPGRRAA